MADKYRTPRHTPHLKVRADIRIDLLIEQMRVLAVKRDAPDTSALGAAIIAREIIETSAEIAKIEQIIFNYKKLKKYKKGKRGGKQEHDDVFGVRRKSGNFSNADEWVPKKVGTADIESDSF